jgi:hypothetical protein
MLLTQSIEVIHDENLPNVMDGVCEAEGSTLQACQFGISFWTY